MKPALLIAAAFFAFAGVAVAQEPPPVDQCAQAYQDVTELGTVSALVDFISAHPDCPEADQARQDLTAFTGQEPAPPAEEQDESSTGAILGGVMGRTLGSPSPAPPPPPSPAPPPPPSPGPSTASTSPGFSMPSDRTVYIPAGRLLKRGDAMIAEGGGYGVILLRRNAPENLAACQVFVRSLGFTQTRDDGLVEQVDGAYVYRRPIYWLTLHNTSATRASDCPTMLANYDYDRAAIMLARLQANANGPFLVIWRADGRSAGLFDYSELSPADLDRQFDRSLFDLAQSDQIWSAGFYERASFQARLQALIAGITAPAKFVSATLINFRPPTLRFSQ